MAHDVFISYSSKDKPIADAICASIEREGIRCWIAPRDIAAGEDWPTSISNAISVSHSMVLVFSSSSNSSDDVSRELYLAASSKLIIIPFKIEDIEPEPGKRYYLARTHWLDAMNPPTQEQIQILVDRVKFVIDSSNSRKISQNEPGTRSVYAIPGQPTAPKAITAPRIDIESTSSTPTLSGRTGGMQTGKKILLTFGGACLLIALSLGVLYGITRSKGIGLFHPSTTVPPAQTPVTTTASPVQTADKISVLSPTSLAAPVHIRWFVGLELGNTSQQIAIEQEVVDNFNASHDNIELTLEVVPSDSAKDILKRQIDAGNAPDIIGPQSFSPAGLFRGQWLDLAPYLDQVDTTLYNPVLMSMYLTEEGQVALPFMVLPAVLFYNPAFFDQAGLDYPPAHYGDSYKWLDGQSLAWDWNVLADVGRVLTLDAAGRNALKAGFDRNNIVQYGFHWVWDLGPNPFFGGGSPIQGEPGDFAAVFPDLWKDAWQWSYAGVWDSQPFIPTASVATSNAFGGGNTFSSGKIAMAAVPSWYLCCLDNYVAAGNKFDFGILPSYNNQIHGRFDEAAFRIWKGTRHPAEAFEVLYWLSTVGIDKLIVGAANAPSAYSSTLPAITSKQQIVIDADAAAFPFVTHWDVLTASLSYPDLPGMQTWLPNYTEVSTRISTFQQQMNSTAGFNLSDEIEKLRSDLTVIFNK
jgi:multiple sugar transport system substrate-binding protein